ncbi:MAG: hypothetical protein LBO69_05560 [Ignavibacteria bacterium]|jgi:hypothetical protein|nr:hypothetical protein [Ignavibacteria bacterium]
MSRHLADALGISIEPTPEGERNRITKDKLETYGIVGKDSEILPVVEVSSISIPKNTPITTVEFFQERNANTVLRNVEFPNKNKAFNINCIAVELNLNLGENMQETLAMMNFFLENSVLKTKWMRTEQLSIPLKGCVPFVIEFDGEKYTTRIVRDGFVMEEGIKIPMNGEFEATIHPAQGYKTHQSNINPAPNAENEIRLVLMGYSIQTPVV